MRDAVATEVHVRVSSPPVKHPCFMGVDMATYHELIAAKIDVEAIRNHIGADSLSFLSLDGMLGAIRGDDIDKELTGRSSYCTACFSGQYPVSVPDWLFRDERSKNVFESSLGGES